MELIAVTPTLEEVMDADGVLRRARDVLPGDYAGLIVFRLDVEEAIAADSAAWRCPFCAQPVTVRCQVRHKADERDVGAFHFQHVHHNPDCPGSKAGRWSQAQILAAKYHGQREGPAHRRLKALLVDSLRADARFSDVRVEATWRGSGQPDKWRRPDVSARFGGQPIVFEIQLSTTFVSVMAERRLFYRNEGVCLVWVVADFDPTWTTLAHESAFYPNNSNIFIVTDHTRALSLAQDACQLEVVWSQPVLERGQILTRIERAVVDAGALTLDAAGMRVFYVDVDGERQALQAQLTAARQQAEASQQRAATQRREDQEERFRRAFERLWMEGLEPARSQADYLRGEREWRTLHHPARLLGLDLPTERREIATALNAIYSVRDAHLGRLVGFRLADLVKLGHFLHTSHKPLLWPFRQALAVYARGELMTKLDHTGKWREKAAEYKQAMRRNAPEYRTPEGLLPLLCVLFPELAPALRESPVTVLAREASRASAGRQNRPDG